MNLIVAVDKNWAIGNDNKLLVSIPQDMKFFRETTMGKVVVMGRKTLESFPGGQPLKKRTNIVITGDRNYDVKDAIVVHSIEEALEELKKYDQDDIYVIGGESAVSREIEAELKNYAEVVRIFGNSRYETSVAVANTFFGEIEEVVVASGKNFPDGLCGGALAAAIDATLIEVAFSRAIEFSWMLTTLTSSSPQSSSDVAVRVADSIP